MSRLKSIFVAALGLAAKQNWTDASSASPTDSAPRELVTRFGIMVLFSGIPLKLRATRGEIDEVLRPGIEIISTAY
jgi:hypothetical protein